MTDRSVSPARSGRRGASFGARMRLDWWWIAILALCGGFQIFRGAPVDGVFFLVAAAALLTDATGVLAAVSRYPLPRVALWLQLVLGLIVVAIIAFSPQFSVVDLVVVAAIGIAAAIAAWRSDEDGETAREGDAGHDGPATAALRRSMRRSAWLWAAGGLFLCVWELATFFLSLPSARADYEHPPLTDLVEPLLADPIWRAIVAALWLLAGAALLQRGRRR